MGSDFARRSNPLPIMSFVPSGGGSFGQQRGLAGSEIRAVAMKVYFSYLKELNGVADLLKLRRGAKSLRLVDVCFRNELGP